MGICFPICFISQAALVLMLPKDCGFQQLLLVGQLYLFWFSQGRLNWAPGAVLTQLLLSDSSFWNWWSQGHATTFCHFSRLALHLQEKRARCVLSTSLRLWKSLHSQLQKSASSSVTHSQLPSEGLHMRWAEATEARCWARNPAFTLQDHVNQSEHTSGSGSLCTS